MGPEDSSQGGTNEQEIVACEALYSPPSIVAIGNISSMLAADNGSFADAIVPLTSSQPGG